MNSQSLLSIQPQPTISSYALPRDSAVRRFTHLYREEVNMKILVHNQGKTTGYMQLHTMPPDGFVMWSEEEQHIWTMEQLRKSPAVAIEPGFNGEVELSTPDLSTGVTFISK